MSTSTRSLDDVHREGRDTLAAASSSAQALFSARSLPSHSSSHSVRACANAASASSFQVGCVCSPALPAAPGVSSYVSGQFQSIQTALPAIIRTVYTGSIAQGEACLRRRTTIPLAVAPGLLSLVLHSLARASERVVELPPRRRQLSLEALDLLPLLEKCQFRTEKYQFRTEKCQFRTETCQFSNSGPEHCDSGTLLGIGPPSLYWYPSLDCKEGVTTYHPGTTHLSRPRTHSSRAVLAARETTNGY